MRVMLVEDDELEVRFLERRFAKAQISTRACHSAEVAMAELTDGALEELDWIVVDVRLPGASGFDLIDWLARQRAERRPRVVVFTTSDFHRDLTAARRHDVDAYFVKGFGEESADRMIRHMMSVTDPQGAEP
jgi:DNA-binding response OmpR family regulator